MKVSEVVLALFGIAWYNLYWRNLSAEERFIRRNQLTLGEYWNATTT